MSEPTTYETKVLRMIAKNYNISGNKSVALVASARRLINKGYAVKGIHYDLTHLGRQWLNDQKEPTNE